MIQREINGSVSNYARLLKECAKFKHLRAGKKLHARVKQCGFDSNIYMGNTVINMYADCGSILYAREVFDKMPEHNLYSWTAIISAYAKNCQPHEAIGLYLQMQRKGVAPDNVVFVFALKACGSMRSLETGKHVHAGAVKWGFESDVSVGNTVIDMYAKCYSTNNALYLFHKLYERDVVSWNAVISGCIYGGLWGEAFSRFEQMQEEGFKPNHVTYVMILKTCATSGSLDKGKQIHVQILERRFESELCVSNTLVDMYAKCGSIDRAYAVFNGMSKKDMASWNVMIGAYTLEGFSLEALKLFKQIEGSGLQPNSITFATILKACTNLEALELGRNIHARVIDTGIELDFFACSTLVDMYVKCDSIKDARQVFSEMSEWDLVSWNVIIAGCAQQGPGAEVLMLFEQMLQESNMPDNVTYISILKACSTLGILHRGKHVHARIVKIEISSGNFVSNALIDMYTKCGSMENAIEVFMKMQKSDEVSWNTIIGCFVQEGLGDKAMILFEYMLQEHVLPNKVTFIAILKACSSMAVLGWGKQIHDLITRSIYGPDITVASTLVDMYAKCGSIENAFQVFNGLPERQVISWTSMIAGCAQLGHSKEALQLFQQMQDEGIRPDNMTLVFVLSSCSRAGLPEDGFHLFQSMSKHYGITPTTEHFACMVHLLGHAGQLLEAEDMINNMPTAPDVVVWMALLDACRIHAKMELGLYAFKHVVKLEPKCIGAHVLLSNIYAAAGRWDEVTRIRKEMTNALCA